MDKFDELMKQGLSAEDQELLARHAEPGYLTQAFGLFRGSWRGVMWLVYLMVGVAAACALYACWRLYQTSEVLDAVKWGVGALLLFQVAMTGKHFMGSHLEANRMLRELKRVELQLSLLRGR
jgi:hypothetical protein